MFPQGSSVSESTAVNPDEEAIVDRIFDAVIEQRLPPGTKLSEPSLCRAFGVSRMRIRRALLLLASREVVEIVSNRGAFIASPSARSAQDVFEARKTIEPNIVRLAIQQASDEDIRLLKENLEQEFVAHESGNRHDAIRLSGTFHVILAQIAGNTVLLRIVKELIARSSLILGVFGAPGVASCRNEDHFVLLDAIGSRDKDLAAKLMLDHLEEIYANLDFEAQLDEPVDLARIFSRQ